MASILKRKGKRGTAYTIVYRLNGRQKWKNAGKLYSVAKIKLKEIEYKLAIGSQEDLLRKDKNIPISQYAQERYLPWIESRRAPKSYSTAKNSFVHLLRFFKDTPLPCITPKMIEDYVAHRRQTVGPRTINLDLIYLGAMFNLAIKEKYLHIENPVKNVEKLKVPKRHPRFLSIEELRRLWDASSAWVRMFIMVSAYTGMRAGEVSNFRWRDIDWVRNVIKIPETKTGREREVPINGILKNTLLWLRHNQIDFRRQIILPRAEIQLEYVFCDLDGSKITSFRGGFRKARAKAGITNITIHTLRHTYASHLANNGTPLLTIKDLLGHTDIKTTTIYAHLSNEHLQRAVEQIDYGMGKTAKLPSI